MILSDSSVDQKDQKKRLSNQALGAVGLRIGSIKEKSNYSSLPGNREFSLAGKILHDHFQLGDRGRFLAVHESELKRGICLIYVGLQLS